MPRHGRTSDRHKRPGKIDVVADHDPEKAALEKKIADLQNKNDALYAEVHELRRQIRKYKHIEEMYQQGKKVIL
jgi:cell division protein FtsB